MPCLILTGCPCVGKTIFAKLLGERAKQHGEIRRVVIINEESACPDSTKAQCYSDSNAEKKTRGALKAEFDRAVAKSTKDTMVIFDSMNYIKGYRYELHCISKAAGERHGVVWILNEDHVAKEWNKKRREENGPDFCFSDQMMEELALRYEPPDARNRWDKPLYRMNVTPKGSGTTASAAKDALQRSVYNMHSLSDAITKNDSATGKKTAASSFKRAGFRRAAPTQQSAKQDSESGNGNSIPANKPVAQTKDDNEEKETEKEVSLENRIDEMLDSFLLDVQPLKEGLSTRQQMTAEANVLNEADSITQQVCSSVMTAQKMMSVTGGNIPIPVGKESVTMELRRTVSIAELKRLRRQYIRWIANHPPEDATELGIVTSFVAYIQDQI